MISLAALWANFRPPARARPDGQGLGLDIALRITQLLGMELSFAASAYGGLQVDIGGPALAET